MKPLFGLFQIVLCAAGHHFLLEPEVVVQHLLYVEHLWLPIHKSQHYHAEGILKLGVLIELI